MRVYRTQQFIRPDLQAHIFSQDLLNNVRHLRSLCSPKTKFCAVVKANAYGHGLAEIVNILVRDGADAFAVATFYEALHIASMVFDKSILILEPMNPSQSIEEIQVCARSGFDGVLSSLDSLNYIKEALKKTSLVQKVHINIETGMGRGGIAPEQAGRMLEQVEACPNLKLAGVFTHFATADEDDLSYAYEQIEVFERFLNQYQLRNRNILIHAANSAAVMKLPQAHYDMVRCGIAMYGYYSRRMKNPPIPLQPVLTLQAPITHIAHIPAGHSISYGRSYVTKRDTTAAIIPLGYADGYRRCFSNRAFMKIAHQAVPVIGRVCMDQVILDVTDVPNIQLGQMVTVLDNSHDSVCSAYALADLADTICYEILTLIHAHVNRIVH
ncbi:MAG TPA: alanine racemase [Anaerohalosphaeraceae bacterium]|nr:alanine racemase [Phycisphaerae bacterium]HOL31665.1 alanine racemase [Anaerohalosphaeraceae bacterium]HOM75386.1 alanine racemase [Anaerohalosphaeraceae bacterium]HPC64882.1 alanine racemase [Anaerohalosphaeraceae bacterium]HPO69370.1 alanine racemase [Anaerohalosphaeraceae bacterium]